MIYPDPAEVDPDPDSRGRKKSVSGSDPLVGDMWKCCACTAG